MIGEQSVQRGRAVRAGRNPVLAATVAVLLVARPAAADEGASLWIPGQFSSLAAVPNEPGYSVPLVYYHAAAQRNWSIR
jgi:hypothetical protein